MTFECDDLIAWNFEKSGLFTVRSAYRLAMNLRDAPDVDASSSSPDGERKLWKRIWSAQVPSKVRVFAWKVVNNGLPTKANRCYRRLDEQSICELCGLAREDVFHAVIICPHARALREAMRDQWLLPGEEDLLLSGPDWLLLLVDKIDDQVRDNFLMLIWRCWNVRNSVLMAGESISVEGSVIFLSRYWAALLQIRQQAPAGDDRGKQKMYPEPRPSASPGMAKARRRWSPPVGEGMKINVDGAYIVETGAATLGVIIRDSSGKPVLMDARQLSHCGDAKAAGALACLEGLKMGARWADRDMILEADNVGVIEKLRKGGTDRSVVAPFIHDALQEMRMLRRVEFVKISREQNKVAYELAHRALNLGVSCVWFGNFPECLVTCL